jgi:hypothetical protein|tara:strand:- start:334 stop:642 length:309 start_codon:yes stop_codon:yes gene_type:complete
MDQYLTYLYGISQSLVFLIYIPALKTIWESPRAEAINVPAQFTFFIIGAISALYMIVVNGDRLATMVICGHIFIGNLSTALIALYKQRKGKTDDRREEDKAP